MTALPKFCVFCGNKPDNKTKEHIIPKWLIKLTGKPYRKINLGIQIDHKNEKYDFKLREFSFSAFHFPACKKCNEEFSALENETKPIIEKILLKNFLTNTEINILLNWFDKVRIGLWLGSLLLDQEVAHINPKFHINNRIAKKDRSLFVYEINDDLKGVQFLGSNTPAFKFTPSCFSLCINNFYFFNISIDFLFARNIGFPFPVKKIMVPKSIGTLYEFSKGLDKVKLPLIKRSFANASFEIFQPIIPKETGDITTNIDDYFNCSYVKENCLDFKNGLGDIFYSDNSSLIKLDKETKLCFSEDSIKYDRKEFMKVMAKQVIDTQLYLTIQMMPSLEELSPSEKKEVTKIQNNIIKLQKKYRELIE